MRHFKNIKENGPSLRILFLFMMILSLSIMVILLGKAYQTRKAFHSLSEAADIYIEMEKAVSSALEASDILTEQVQCYTILGDREHLEGYFSEVRQSRKREQAIETMREQIPDSKAFQELECAMKDSNELMEREYYAMLLVLTALKDEDIPEEITSIHLSQADSQLSAKEQQELAQIMTHDDGYYQKKEEIRAHLSYSIRLLQTDTRLAQEDSEIRVRKDLGIISMLILLQSFALILMIGFTTKLGIHPILEAVENIQRDESLPIIGAHEFRHLANAYNRMYRAYKTGIENLSYKATHDELTGTYNRAGYDLLKESVDFQSTAFLLIDVDFFKSINDAYGHDKGDEVLQWVAQVLKANFRSEDYICRIGGDEFAVFMSHMGKECQEMIERKIAKINQDLKEGRGQIPPVSISVGISFCQEMDIQKAFLEADKALYNVKQNGRQGCCFYGRKDTTVLA